MGTLRDALQRIRELEQGVLDIQAILDELLGSDSEDTDESE